jgi:superfamily II DNA helicase RecQ
MNNSVEHPIHPILLVQGTGGGKLSDYQTIGVIKRGVSVIIENTLLLSYDQLSKIKKISKQLPNIHSFQFDSIKTKSTCMNLANQIKNIRLTSSTTIN